MLVKVICRSALILCFLGSAMAQAASVVFLNPGNAKETFWLTYSQFMQAAASNLGLQLEIQYAGHSAETAIRQAREALHGPHRPDYLVFVNEQYIAPQILRLSQGSGVKLFMVNSALTPKQARLVQPTEGNFLGWVGSIVANDEEAGYLMLNELVRQHGPLAEGQTVDLLAFSGVKNTPASQLREKGLRRALAEHPEVRLRQLVYGEWNQQRAHEQATLLLKRYPDTAMVWSANDEMAFGAMRAAEEVGLIPGRDLLFSAVNSSIPALQARASGRLSALVAGHFTVGGWAMALLSDDAKGVDISRFGGRDWQLPLLQLLNAQQAKQLLAVARGGTYGLDFSRYSAQGKPDTYRYPFSLKAVIKAL